jgi:hypothetical protein
MSDGTHHGFLFPPLRGGWQRLQALTEGVRRFPPGAAPDPLRLLRRHLPLSLNPRNVQDDSARSRWQGRLSALPGPHRDGDCTIRRESRWVTGDSHDLASTNRGFRLRGRKRTSHRRALSARLRGTNGAVRLGGLVLIGCVVYLCTDARFPRIARGSGCELEAQGP